MARKPEGAPGIGLASDYLLYNITATLVMLPEDRELCGFMCHVYFSTSGQIAVNATGQKFATRTRNLAWLETLNVKRYE